MRELPTLRSDPNPDLTVWAWAAWPESGEGRREQEEMRNVKVNLSGIPLFLKERNWRKRWMGQWECNGDLILE